MVALTLTNLRMSAARMQHQQQQQQPTRCGCGRRTPRASRLLPTPRSHHRPTSSLSQAPPIRAPLPPDVAAIAHFRFWHDEKRFRGSGDESLAQHTWLAAGGVRMGGNAKGAPTQGRMGWQVPDSWDLLWSTSDGAHKAAPLISRERGQLVNALPGLEQLTRKRNLAATVGAAYGEDAWQLLPRSYSIPSQLLQWRQRLASEAAAGWWVLKTGEHLGQGLRVVPSHKALSALLERNKPFLTPPPAGQQQQQQPPASSSSQTQARHAAAAPPPAPATSGQPSASSSSSSSHPRPFIAVQQYVTQPLLVQGRKFGLRVWVLVLGPQPYRAFVYQQGLALFSGQDYSPDLAAVAEQGPASQGHLTNAALWQSGQQGSRSSTAAAAAAAAADTITLEQLLSSTTSSSTGSSSPQQQPVWTLQQLFDVLGPEAAEGVWQQVTQTAGRLVAAAGGPVHAAAQQLGWTGDAAFELLGLDFLLDASCRPWLLEVNASPSLAWHTPGDAAASSLMWGVKQRMMADLAALLRLQERFPAPHSTTAAAAAARGASGSTAKQAVRGQQRQEQEQDQQQAGAGVLNPVLVKAASARYFAGRPLVAGLVAHNTRVLAAAAAAAPSRQVVAAQVQRQLEALQQQSTSQPSAHRACQDQQQREQPLQCVGQQELALLQAHLQELVQVECEAASGGDWQSLLGHMPCRAEAAAHGWQLGVADADEAVRLWWPQRACTRRAT